MVKFNQIKKPEKPIHYKDRFILSQSSADKIKKLISDKKINYKISSYNIVIPSSKFHKIKNRQLNKKFYFLAKSHQKEIYYKLCLEYYKIRKLFVKLVEYSEFLYDQKEENDIPSLANVEKKIENFYYFNLDEFIKEINNIFDFYYGLYACSPTNYKLVKDIDDFFTAKSKEIKEENVIVKDEIINEDKRLKLIDLIQYLNDDELIILIGKFPDFFDARDSGMKKIFTLKQIKISYINYKIIKNFIYQLNPNLKHNNEPNNDLNKDESVEEEKSK